MSSRILNVNPLKKLSKRPRTESTPVTFGSLDLREVMLRGAVPDPMTLGMLALIGILCYVGASMELSRRMATQ